MVKIKSTRNDWEATIEYSQSGPWPQQVWVWKEGQEKSQGKTYWASTRDEHGCFGKVGSGSGRIRAHRRALEKRKSVGHRTAKHCGMVYHWKKRQIKVVV